MKKFFQNSFVLITYTTLTVPLGFFLRLVYANNLSITEFGLFYAILNFFGLVSVFNDLGFAETQSYFIPKFHVKGEHHKIKAALKVAVINQVITTSFFTLTLLLLSNFISVHFFKHPEAIFAFRFMIVYYILSDILTNISILFYAYREPKIYGSTEVVRLTLTLLSVVIFLGIFPQEKLLAVVWGWVAVYIAMVVGYGLLFLKRHGSVLKAPHYPIREIYREFIPFAVPSAVKGGASIIMNNTSVSLLTYLKGVESVAIYNIAQPVANVVFIFVTPIASLLGPITVEFDAKKNYKDMQQMIQAVLDLGVFLLLPAILSLMIYSYEIIDFLFKSKYTYASVTLRFFAVYIFFVVLNQFIYNIVAGLGIPKERMKIMYGSAGINLFFCLVLIPFLSANGAVCAGIAANIFLMFGGLYLLRKKTKIVLPWRIYLKLIGLSVFFVLLNYVLIHLFALSNIFLKVGVNGIISGGIYLFIGIFILKIVNVEEIKRVWALRSTGKVKGKVKKKLKK
jgi:O-antigen/teichoic acid export membrane protein